MKRRAHVAITCAARKGVYRAGAILIVYPAPPFTGTVVRLLTYADVRVTQPV